MRSERGEPVVQYREPPHYEVHHIEGAKLQRAVRNVDREDASSPILAGEE